MSGGELESSELGEYLGSESGNKVGASKGISEGNAERKVGGSSGVSEKVPRVDLAAGPIVMGSGAVSEVVVM